MLHYTNSRYATALARRLSLALHDLILCPWPHLSERRQRTLRLRNAKLSLFSPFGQHARSHLNRAFRDRERHRLAVARSFNTHASILSSSGLCV